MKKSMIISTIAMIVVVVVALSTATYAWFTSSAITKATVTMKVTSTGDFAIAKGTGEIVDGSITYSFVAASSDDVQLEGDLKEDIFAPATNAALGTMNAALIAGGKLTSNPVNFVKADTVGGTDKASIVPTAKKATAIRVSNVSGAPKALRLSIVLNTKKSNAAEITDGTKYAASATSFAIAYAIVDNTASTATFSPITNGYNVASNTSYNVGDPVSKGDAIPATTSGGANNNITISKPDQSNFIDGTAFSQAGTVVQGSFEETCGITDGQYYYIYNIDFGNVGATQYVYFVFYTWFDGFETFDTAKGSEFDLTYAFYQTPSAG